jgi:COP9 signalosome complex subunit 3
LCCSPACGSTFFSPRRPYLLQLIPLPNFATQVTRDIAHRCVPYTELCSAYLLKTTTKIETVAGSYSDQFESDHNFGLVKQCIIACLRNNIRRHTQTFLTLSLEDIAQNVGITSARDAEKHVFQMVRYRRLN